MKVTKAILINETGGKENCNEVRGKSGEITCMQFMPTTYKAYAKETVGRELPPTKVNSMYISALKVEKWIRQGKTDSQILLIWNAGENAKKCGSGTNKYKVKYNSCQYVKDGLSILARI